MTERAYLTARDVAQLLGLSRSQAYEVMKRCDEKRMLQRDRV